MNKKIKDIDDIKFLVEIFYYKVEQDSLLGHVFNDVMKVNWKSHLPQMVDFLITILLGVVAYKGNPMLKHFMVNKQIALTPLHFERWLELWQKTIDSHFEGKIATIAKQRAKNMAIGIQRTLVR